MDYKEKLKLAKEALDSGSYDKETIEYIFPELKESDNKKVRIKLIEFFKGYFPDKEWWGNITQRDILTWFENHDEQKSWSKEDEMQLDAAIHLVSNTGHIETANWLKSFKNRVPSQSTWKPSDEQFKLLKHIMENVPLSYIDKSEVGGLYLDLKRLIGE